MCFHLLAAYLLFAVCNLLLEFLLLQLQSLQLWVNTPVAVLLERMLELVPIR